MTLLTAFIFYYLMSVIVMIGITVDDIKNNESPPSPFDWGVYLVFIILAPLTSQMILIIKMEEIQLLERSLEAKLVRSPYVYFHWRYVKREGDSDNYQQCDGDDPDRELATVYGRRNITMGDKIVSVEEAIIDYPIKDLLPHQEMELWQTITQDIRKLEFTHLENHNYPFKKNTLC